MTLQCLSITLEKVLPDVQPRLCELVGTSQTCSDSLKLN